MSGRLSGFEQLSGEEWEALCLRVLHEHHPGHELVEVPDQDRGDAGLEAFSISGVAYQCYNPEGEPLRAAQRLQKQRKKMDEDIAKFIDNADKIRALLPPGLTIKHWVLLVPYISSRQLLEHAATKTTKVRNACLEYADSSLVVTSHTLDSYERAREAVVSRQLTKFHLPPVQTTSYGAIDDPLIEVIHSKLAKTDYYSDDGRRTKLVDRLLTNQVAGRSHRDHVRDQYSELGDDLESRLADLEERLAVQYPLSNPVADRLLQTVLADAEGLVTDVLNTRPSDSRVIAEGQVCEWLMNCPLDFP
ncbi:MAG: hypothetical protein ACXVX9_03220 [Mycobacteriaceae bacterium]